ncbi:MAG: aminoacetone oxidase family FAD-binding enzyme [Lachnospiraceae bacterium]|nr:aminoacetone oxidase family FAD-binding enzyme [Lachnospiraceae bacterium]
MKNRTAVIGGGYGGMTAAIFEKRNGNDVTIFERQESLGKKLLLTGNGRCNISNESIDVSDYVTDDAEKLQGILDRFDRDKEDDFFSSVGLFTRNDRGCLYPLTGKAKTVVNCLLYALNELGVDIRTGCYVSSLAKNSDGLFDIAVGSDVYGGFTKVILASGGMAGIYEEANKNGNKLAVSCGHALKEGHPGLTAVICSDDKKKLKKIDGIRVRAMASVIRKGEKIAFEEGEIQHTAEGLSGIPVFGLSRYLDDINACLIRINYLPELTYDDFKKRIGCFGNRSVETFLEGVVLSPIAEMISGSCGINYHVRISQLSEEDIKKLYQALTAFDFHPVQLNGYKKAQISTGGVPLSEIDENMQSVYCEGLYLVGEVLNVAGRCGGYNLHFAAASAFCAAESHR